MKCSKRMCPMQHNTISDDCDIKDCPYRTEDIDQTEVMKMLCNNIADLVVEKLKSENKEKQEEDVAKAFQLGLAFGFGEKHDEMDKVMEEVKKVITPQPKIGYWIINTDLGYYVSTCSNCDWKGHGDTVLIYRPKYCPNCGAKMIESEDEE